MHILLTKICLNKITPCTPSSPLPWKSSGSAHDVEPAIADWRVSLSFQRLYIYRSRQQTFFFRLASDISAIFTLFSSTCYWIPGVLVYQKHTEKQAHLPAVKCFYSVSYKVLGPDHWRTKLHNLLPSHG